MYWFCDFKGYQFNTNNFIVKEISILSSDGLQCFTYLIKSPSQLMHISDNATLRYQFNRHKLHLKCGDYNFNEAMHDIYNKTANHMIFVKGFEKTMFLNDNYFHAKELQSVPAFKRLTNCLSECCNYSHGIYCARRKVHELKHFIDANNIIL
jgi:hypothetical protein